MVLGLDAKLRVSRSAMGYHPAEHTAKLDHYGADDSRGMPAPAYYHCPLVRDEDGVRLSKRHDALSLRQLRARGASPESIRASFEHEN